MSTTEPGRPTAATNGSPAADPLGRASAAGPLSRVDVSALVRTRVHHPEAIAEAAARRTRRP